MKNVQSNALFTQTRSAQKKKYVQCSLYNLSISARLFSFVEEIQSIIMQHLCHQINHNFPYTIRILFQICRQRLLSLSPPTPPAPTKQTTCKQGIQLFGGHKNDITLKTSTIGMCFIVTVLQNNLYNIRPPSVCLSRTQISF